MAVRSIVIHAGSAASIPGIGEFARRKQKELVEAGVYWPKEFQASQQSFYPIHDLLLGSLLNKEQCPQFELTIDRLKRDVDEAGHEEVWLSCPLLFHVPQTLERFRKACASLFPSSRIQLVLSFTRQDVDIDAWVGYNILHTTGQSNRGLSNIMRGKYREYDSCVKEGWNTFGKDNVLAAVDDWNVNDPTTSVRQMVAASELVSSDTAGWDLLASPYGYHALPSELVDFICTVNSLVFSGPRSPTPLPWNSQVSRFLPEAGFTSAGPFRMQPEMRREIQTRFAESNERMSELVGKPLPIIPTQNEDTHYCLKRLDEQDAYRVAERLDREILEQVDAELEKHQEDYLSYAQRLVKRAVHDVLDSGSAAVHIPHREVPKVSVVTMTYNHAKYIKRCIESVCEQRTTFPIQHIIADDCSDDGTREIIMEYAAKYPHIVPVFQPKRSYGSGTVRAMFDLARSPFVAPCDGDDYFTDRYKLQIQLDYLEANPNLSMCFHPVEVIYEAGERESWVFPSPQHLSIGWRPVYTIEDLIQSNFMQTNSVMYRWRFTEGLPDWFRPDLCPGDWYWHLLHAEMGDIGLINRVMAAYWRHINSVYYMGEFDTAVHRSRVGMAELETYKVVNEHFKGKYRPALKALACGVFASAVRYQAESGDYTLLEKMTEKYPEFARYFLYQLRVQPKQIIG